ncbi:putative peptidoglycan binding protein [Roseinatronobacter bogoriensis subsp. barguzinensis]|uniref:Peptidoglycan binding-like domain-containing protein n=2 Tax=Roseinatronobacter bogoriensis TaxID=119542 RepID=A0A2K8KGG5_9RHOB|nr:hypothetical protein BG454_08645 [Rhodobaca barguzinensis]TDW38783.1 putative peptidoglycan binding protein [Rhodobaca barguzinensis]TDY69179.1 putative peptidoglycan binding protein [Rhodobaca bogoriensis DSM 18756]
MFSESCDMRYLEEDMSHRESHTRWSGAALALLAAVIAGPASGDSVMVTQAKVQLASISLSAPTARECWARYSSASSSTVIEEVAFRVPCPEQITHDFMQALQRSLAARGFYDGQVTGKPDAQTRAAVQAFQGANGFNSPILTLEAAQQLGLLPIDVQRN